MSNKSIWLGLVTSALFTFSSLSVLADSDIYQVNASPSLIIRDSPSIDGEKLGSIPNGEEIEVLEITDDTDTIDGETGKWVRLEWDGVEGYVFGAYIDLISEAGDSNDTLSQVASTTPAYTPPVIPQQNTYIQPSYQAPAMTAFDREMQEINMLSQGAINFGRANGITPTTDCEKRQKKYEECERTKSMMDSGVSKSSMGCSRWLEKC